MKTFFVIALFCCMVFPQRLTIGDSLLTDKPLKNPTKAYLWSMGIPGAGQIYNEDYWKTALIVPAFSYLLYQAIDKNRRRDFLSLRVHFRESQILKLNKTTDEEKLSELNTQLNNDKKELLNVSEERNLAIWYAGLVYLINVLDAYISAYLFGFDEIMDHDENRKFKMSTTFRENRYELQFQLNF